MFDHLTPLPGGLDMSGVWSFFVRIWPYFMPAASFVVALWLMWVVISYVWGLVGGGVGGESLVADASQGSGTTQEERDEDEDNQHYAQLAPGETATYRRRGTTITMSKFK